MKEIVKLLKEKGLQIATMESCTGGSLVNEITSIEGASEILKFSAVTYSNEYKIKMGVSREVIEKYTVYSMETADEMSKQISDFSNADIGIGITGKLGKKDPNNLSGEDNKVYVSIYLKDKGYYHEEIVILNKERIENKQYIVDKVKNKLLEILSNC